MPLASVRTVTDDAPPTVPPAPAVKVTVTPTAGAAAKPVARTFGGVAAGVPLAPVCDVGVFAVRVVMVAGPHFTDRPTSMADRSVLVSARGNTRISATSASVTSPPATLPVLTASPFGPVWPPVFEVRTMPSTEISVGCPAPRTTLETTRAFVVPGTPG